MASSFDELIERLLYDVALSGSQGIGARQFENSVRTFYAEKDAVEVDRPAEEQQDLLFSDAPPGLKFNVDDSFVRTAFEWLCKHRDVEIKDAPIDEEAPGTSSPQAVPEGPGETSDDFISSALKDKLGDRRISTTDDRVWHAIAGHGVDYGRIPPKEFELLSAVAACGSAGILQPHLCKLTGQDKRSVPHRTDCLAQKGYIIKIGVIGSKSRTSMLKLKRYGQDPTLSGTGNLPVTSDNPNSAPVIVYDAWFNEMVKLLKENDNIISMNDLRIGLGINQKQWETKALVRCVRRLDQGGFVRRLTARMQDREGNALKRLSTGKDRKVKSIQMLREPTDMDRILFTQSVPKQKGLGAAANEAVEDEDDALDSDEEGRLTGAEGAVNDLDLIKQRTPPQWTPDIPYTNFIFNLVDHAGAPGLSSMKVAMLGTGPAWRRPLDEALAKLTDVWKFSQPPHLRHLTLVRDTAVHAKMAHYQYRSLAHFQQAVELGDVVWEAVGGDPNATSGTAAKQRWSQPDLDEWGFPKLQAKDFAGRTGRASLSDAMKSIKKPQHPSVVKYLQKARNLQGPDGNSHAPRLPVVRPNKRPIEGDTAAATKRRKMNDNESKEFERIAQGMAERQVMYQLRTELKAKADGNDPQGGDKRERDITLKNLPADAVQKVKAELLGRQRSGVYINPPGSRALKIDNFYHRGRPRNALIMVVKSNELKQLPWFVNEEESWVEPKRVPPKPSKVRTHAQMTRDHTSYHSSPQQRKRRCQDGGIDKNPESSAGDAIFKLQQAFLQQAQAMARPPTPVEKASSKPQDVGHEDEPDKRSDPENILSQQETQQPSAAALASDNGAGIDQEQVSIKMSRLNALNGRMSELRHKRGRRTKQVAAEIKQLEIDIAALKAELHLPVTKRSHNPHRGRGMHAAGSTISRPTSSFAQTAGLSTTNGPLMVNNNATTSTGTLGPAQDSGSVSQMQRETDIPKSASRTTPSFAQAGNGRLGDDQPAPKDLISPGNTSITPDVASRLGSVMTAATDNVISNPQIQPYISEAQPNNVSALPPMNSEPVITGGEPFSTQLAVATHTSSALPESDGQGTIMNQHLEDHDKSKDNSVGNIDALPRPPDTNANQVPATADSDVMDIDGPEYLQSFDIQQAPVTEAMIPGKSPSKRSKKAGTLRTGGSVAIQRSKVIFDAIRQCGGVFPGNHEMWYVVMSFWQKKFNQIPDKNTIDRAVTNLVASGSLKKFTFQFKTKKGLIQSRSILAEPGMDPKSAVFQAMQQKIKDTWPGQYLPPDVEIDDQLRSQASNGFGRKKAQEPDPMDIDQPDVRPKLYEKYPLDTLATVRQTDYSLELSDEEARSQGFKDAEAYRLHRIQHNPTYWSFWRRNGLLEGLDIGSRPVRRIRPKPTGDELDATTAGLQRPLSTLRGNGPRGVVKRQQILKTKLRYLPSLVAHSKLDPQWFLAMHESKANARKPRRKWWDAETGIVLDLDTTLRSRARMMLLSPAQTFSAGTGTFGTHFPVMGADLGHLEGDKQLKSRAVDMEPAAEPLPDPKTLAEILDRASILGHGPASITDGPAQKFFRDAERVREWELDVVRDGRNVAHKEKQLTFINHALNQAHVVPVLKQTKAPPVSARVEPRLLQPPHLAHLAPKPVTVEPPPVEAQPEAKAPKGKRKYKQRSKLTVIPEVGKQPETVQPPAAPSPPKEGRKRKAYTQRDRGAAASFKDVDRLVTAYALVAAICGGINQMRLNWNLIAHALGFRYEGEFLRRRWGFHRKFRRGEAEKIRDAIREPFLKAYEAGDLPHIDFQNLEKTDWPALLDWVESEILPLEEAPEPAVPDLPESKALLDTSYAIIERRNPYEPSRDDFFAGLTDQGRRHMILRYCHGNLLPGELKPSYVPEEPNVLIKSWVRAVAMTKQWLYEADVAARKIGIFSNQELESTSKEMVDGHVFTQDRKGRQLPGRNFQIHNDVLLQFRRWPGKQDEFKYLRMVAKARAKIVKYLQTHDHIDLVPISTDPQYLVLTNMVAQGLLTITATLPERKDDFEAPFPKLTPWSYSGYNYETKKLNVSNLKFPIVFSKTASYTSEHKLNTQIPIPLEPAVVPGEPGARIPFWVDIHGNLMEDVWDMVVRSILHIVVFRPGYSAQAMQTAHNGKFGAWEIELVLAWLDRVGLVERCGADDEVDGVWKGGWRAAGFWYCAFLPEVAKWKPPAGLEFGVNTA